MIRRSFLASLFALPFAPKVLEAEPRPKWRQPTPEEWRRHIEKEIELAFANLHSVTVDRDVDKPFTILQLDYYDGPYPEKE